jgi:hypothetical protein
MFQVATGVATLIRLQYGKSIVAEVRWLIIHLGQSPSGMPAVGPCHSPDLALTSSGAPGREAVIGGDDE